MEVKFFLDFIKIYSFIVNDFNRLKIFSEVSNKLYTSILKQFMLVSRYLNLWVQKDAHETCDFCSLTVFSSVLCFCRMGWMHTQTRMKLMK